MFRLIENLPHFIKLEKVFLILMKGSTKILKSANNLNLVYDGRQHELWFS